MKNPVLIIDLDTQKVIGMAKTRHETKRDALQSNSGRVKGFPRGIRPAKHLPAALFLLVALSMALFLMPSPAFATDPPDSDPTITNVHANRNLVTNGDIVIYGLYNLPYTSLPDDGAGDTYIIRLVDTDGVTYIGAVTPYVYFDNGYNDGVFSLYFESGAVWETQYIIRISQNPAFFTSPESWDYVISASDWSDETDQDDNQLEMAGNIIILANYLEQQYTAYTLLEGGPTGTILAAPQGETYFRGAIPGIQNMAPSLYLTSVATLDYSSTNWTLTQAEAYASRMETTDIGSAENATATQFGMTRQTILSLALIIPLCLGAMVITAAKYKKPLVGLLVSSVFITMGYNLGWVPPAIFATIFQLMAVYTSYVWFLARAS